MKLTKLLSYLLGILLLTTVKKPFINKVEVPHKSLAQMVGAYPGFYSMKQLVVFLHFPRQDTSPSQSQPQAVFCPYPFRYTSGWKQTTWSKISCWGKCGDDRAGSQSHILRSEALRANCYTTMSPPFVNKTKWKFWQRTPMTSEPQAPSLHVQNIVEVNNYSGLFKANHAIGQWRIGSWPAVTFSSILLDLL